MNTTIQNPERSLDMVVFASLEDCVKALHSLHKDGWFAREKVLVKTSQLDVDLYAFEVTLTARQGNTSLRGALYYDDKFNRTRVSGEVKSIDKSMKIQAALTMILFFGIFTPIVLKNPSAIIFLIIVTAVVPFVLLKLIEADRNDTRRVIEITESVLHLTSSNKKHGTAKYDGNKSPFDKDEEYQRRHGGAAYLSNYEKVK